MTQDMLFFIVSVNTINNMPFENYKMLTSRKKHTWTKHTIIPANKRKAEYIFQHQYFMSTVQWYNSK